MNPLAKSFAVFVHVQIHGTSFGVSKVVSSVHPPLVPPGGLAGTPLQRTPHWWRVSGIAARDLFPVPAR